MSNRVGATITIGGVLRGRAAIERLVGAIVDDGAGENYGSADQAEVEEMILQAFQDEAPLELTASEVKGGELEEIEAACTELGLTRIATWESFGGEWNAGIRLRGPGGHEVEFQTSEDGYIVVTQAAVREALATANPLAAMKDLLEKMDRCNTDNLPPLTFEEV